MAYFGEDPNDHTMDAEALAPVLIGISKLIQITNTEINRDKANVKVLVASEFEHKCFSIHFEVIQNIVQHVKDFLDTYGVDDTSKLLQSIGLVGSVAATTVLGYLKLKKGRTPQTVQRVDNPSNSVILQFQGDHQTVVIPKEVFEIAEKKKQE